MASSYYERNKERLAAQRKTPEYKARRAEYYAQNRDRIRADSLERYRARGDEALIIHRASNSKYYGTRDGFLSQVLKSAKARATKKGLPFSLTREDVVIPDTCPILGLKLVLGGDRNTSPSLDRIDPALGYVPSNVRVISMLANQMKSCATRDQLVTFADNILDYVDGRI